MNHNDEEAYAEIFLLGMRDFLISYSEKLEKRIVDINNNNFNTSLTKVFDNLIMTYVKEFNDKIFDE